MSPWRVTTLSLASAFVTASLAAPRASAYEFLVESQTIGDAYQLVTSGNEVLNRRKLHEYLGLSLWDLTGDQSQHLTVKTLFRFDADFGLTDKEIADTALRRDQLSMQYAYLEGHELLGGYFDFKLGRHLKADAIDYLVMDGVTVQIGTPIHLAAEFEAGMEVKNDLWSLNSNQLESDGTRIIQRDGTDYGDPLADQTQASDATSWVVGAWLMTRDLPYAQYKAGYRRVFSALAVDHEKVGGAFRQRLVPSLDLSGVASYDLFNGRFDRLEGQLRWRITDWTELEVEYVRMLPSFDADSIFNIFTAFPMNDVNLRWRVYPSDADRLYAGGMVRLFGNEGYVDGTLTGDVKTVVESWGAMAGWVHAFGPNGACGRVMADVSAEGGYGGTRLLVDLGGAWSIVPRRWEAEGRLTLVDVDDQIQSNLHALSFGYQLGAKYLIDKRAAFALMAEHNMNRLHNQQIRVFAVIDLALWL